MSSICFDRDFFDGSFFDLCAAGAPAPVAVGSGYRTIITRPTMRVSEYRARQVLQTLDVNIPVVHKPRISIWLYIPVLQHFITRSLVRVPLLHKIITKRITNIPVVSLIKEKSFLFADVNHNISIYKQLKIPINDSYNILHKLKKVLDWVNKIGD